MNEQAEGTGVGIPTSPTWRSVRLAQVAFDLPLSPHQLPALRGAVGHTAYGQSSRLHNHATDGALHYRYPLIQYYIHQGKAAAIGIEQGADELLAALSMQRVVLLLEGHALDVQATHVSFRNAPVLVWDRCSPYRIRQWAPLDRSTEAAYYAARDSNGLAAFFARRLTGNMLSFAKGIGFHVPRQIQTRVLEIDGPYPVGYKGVGRLCFNLTFETNLSLPAGIGLGKHTSVGFGRIAPVRPFHQS